MEKVYLTAYGESYQELHLYLVYNTKKTIYVNMLGKRKHETIEQGYVFLFELTIESSDLELLKELGDLEIYQ